MARGFSDDMGGIVAKLRAFDKIAALVDDTRSELGIGGTRRKRKYRRRAGAAKPGPKPRDAGEKDAKKKAPRRKKGSAKGSSPLASVPDGE